MFLLNGRPIFLRGAEVSPSLNAFWYWHEDDKLLDALLLAKAANCNALRAGEHVLFAEVRELLDRLGIMSEQDQGAGHNTPQSGFTNGNTPAEIAAMARAGTALARVLLQSAGRGTALAGQRDRFRSPADRRRGPARSIPTASWFPSAGT